MSIKRFFNRDVVVRRLKSLGSGKTNYQATATAEGHIQELTPEARQAIGIVEGKVYKAWFDVSEDVDEGDQLTDDKGRVFKVHQTNQQDYGINQHLECIIIDYNE